MKYIKQILLIIIIVGSISFLLLAGMSQGPPTDKYERGQIEGLLFVPNNLSGPGWICYIWLMIVVGALIGIFFSFLLAPLLLFVHKKIIGRKMEYGIEKKPTPEVFKGTFKALLPALFAINLAFMLADITIIQKITTTAYFDQFVGMRRFFVFNTLLPLMMGISMALFSSIWLLQESGIVFTNKDKVKDIKQPTQVGSSGGWYKKLLKGYAGIGVFLIIYYNMMEMIHYTSNTEEGTMYIIITIILLGFLPFLMTLFALPAVVLFDMMQKKRDNYIIKWAKKLGIIDNVEVSFKKINQS